MTFLKQNIKKW